MMEVGEVMSERGLEYKFGQMELGIKAIG